MATKFKIAATLFGKLDTEWSDTTQIAWPNKDFEPAGLSAWLRPTVLWSDADRETIVGDGTDKGQLITGKLVIQIFVKANTDIDTAMTYADTLSGIFNEADLDVSGGGIVRCGVPRLRHVGDDGTWYQINVEVPFEHYITA